LYIRHRKSRQAALKNLYFISIIKKATARLKISRLTNLGFEAMILKIQTNWGFGKAMSQSVIIKL
jgi:hypothetical protein